MINPVDFLSFAEKLLDEGEKEILLRNTISRAYYYAFHHVRENLGIQFKNYKKQRRSINHKERISDHKVLIEFFKENYSLNLATMIHKMYGRRNEADYDLWKDFEKRDAEDFIKDVKSFISNFDASGLA